MSVTNRAAIINKLYKVLKKHYTPVEPPERTVLEHMLYACVLEDTPFDKADIAYNKLIAGSYDWNEIRVTSQTELTEIFASCTRPEEAAARLKNSLQSVFESQYSFDMEPLKKQNLGKAVKMLAGHEGITPYVVSYLTQHALSGHSIPLGQGGLDVMYIVGIISEKERDKKVVPGLERAVSKKQGIEFASLLQPLAAGLVASPFSPAIRNVLLEVDPKCKERLPKRQKKKPEPEPEPAPAKAEPSKSTKKAAAKKESAKDSKSKAKAKSSKPAKASTKPAKPAKKKAPAKAASKKAPAKKKTAKKAAAKKPAKKPAKKKPAKKTKKKKK